MLFFLNLYFQKLVLILKSRKSQILENIEAAEKQREESEQKIKEYEEIFKIVKMKLKIISIKLEKK